MKNKEEKYKQWLKTHSLPRPSVEQLQWLEMEIGMFAHIGVNTYNNKEWSDGSLDPECFNPKKLDCNQWVKVAKDLGAKYYILSAKHHDGFCLWPTNTTDYSIKNTPFKNGKGDLIEEFISACHKGGIKPGLYLSPWDRHEPCYADKDAYDKFYLEQLEELLTWYKWEPVEIWFDGAGSKGRKYDWHSIMNLVEKHAPHAIIFNMGIPTIRWCGNEKGYAPYPNWYVVNKSDIFDYTFDKGETDGLGDYFLPCECDTPIRRFLWFYHTFSRIFLRSKKKLIDIYENSVGKGANLLLNLAPNRDGLLNPADAKRARWLGEEIKKRYGKPLAQKSGIGDELIINLPENTKIHSTIIQEDIKFGQRVRQYELQYKDGQNWAVLVNGSSIGHKKIDRFRPVKTNKIRLKITQWLKEPKIKNFSVFE
ncbi:MAG: alpha-L-fucosidase [Candidatus Lokiarchaeota archaeon]|nr:alpha-L-fucosidase [Candidatus Lokiarchaeota archaeon]